MKALKILSIIFISPIIGFICGLLGGGGGMLCVPFLFFLLKFKEKEAHASAVFIILVATITSSIFYIINGYYNLSVNLPVGVGVFLGGVIGALLLKKTSNVMLEFAFSVIMLIAGLKMLI